MNPRPPKDGSPTPPPPAPTPREELEARLAALVLGEAGEFEAETLRARLAADPELAALHRRLTGAAQALKDTFEDERTAAALPSIAAAPERLDPARRAALEKIFAASGAVAADDPTAAAPVPTRRKAPFLIFPKFSRPILMAAACLMMAGLVVYLAISSRPMTYSAARSTAARPAISEAKSELSVARSWAEPVQELEARMAASESTVNLDENRPVAPTEKILSAQELVASVANAPDLDSERNTGASPAAVDSLNSHAFVLPELAQAVPAVATTTSAPTLDSNTLSTSLNYARANSGTEAPASGTTVLSLAPPPAPPPPPPPASAGRGGARRGSLQGSAAAPGGAARGGAGGGGGQRRGRGLRRGPATADDVALNVASLDTAGTPSIVRDETQTGGSVSTNALGDIGNVAGGASTVAKDGGTPSLVTGASTYTGCTTVSGGTLQLGNGGTTSSAMNNTAVTFSNIQDNAGRVSSELTDVFFVEPISGTGVVDQRGGSVSLPGAGTSLGGLSGDRDLSITNARGTTALTTGGNNQNTTYSGAPSGSGSLFKAGAGTLTLTGTSTFSGGTIIRGGTLELDSGKKIEDSNGTTNFGSGNITLAGGSLQWFAGSSTAASDSRADASTVATNRQRAQESPAKSSATPATANQGESLAQLRQQGQQQGETGGGAQGAYVADNLAFAGGALRYAGSGAMPAPGLAAPAAAPAQSTREYRSLLPTAPPDADQPVARPPSDVKFPPPVATAENAFSTFSLNVSDVAYRLALAALQNRRWPDPAAVRTEEFLNAFNYHDPAPRPGQPGAFSYELAQNPFESGGDLLRVSFQTAASGRDRATPLRLTIVLDGSGSMTRADRVATLQAAIRALGAQLRAGDAVSLVMFARTAQVRAVGVPAERFEELTRLVDTAAPDGGTNLEEALTIGYQIARETFVPNAQNRVILMTDGAANLGQLDPKLLADLVEQNRRGGIALDAYGVGWDGYDDTVLEALTRQSDGRYGFLNRPEDVDAAFASKLAGALAPAALDVKLQIEFNPNRVASYRLMGYNNQRLTKEQFRDNTVNAAELAAAEQGTALYNLVLRPDGTGPVGTARARFRDPATNAVREMAWTIRYDGAPPPFDQAAPSLRLAATAAYFAEYLQQSPFAAEVTPRKLGQTLEGVPEALAPDPRPAALADALFSAAALAGN